MTLQSIYHLTALEGGPQSIIVGPVAALESIKMLGTILIVGALLFLPIAVLGPIAEHVGPIPFGG